MQYIINDGTYIIRPMVKKDVSSYLSLLNISKEQKDEYYKRYKKVFEQQEDDDANLFFAVLKKGKIIGEIGTVPMKSSTSYATVRIILPKNSNERQNVEELFEKLCLEVFLYDIIYLVQGDGTMKERIIVNSSESETS